jgi:hypothetical protein
VLPALLARYAPGRGAPLVAPSQLNASRAAAAKLAGPMTDKAHGLFYSDFTGSPPSWRPDSASVSLNGWAAWLVDQAARLQAKDRAAAEVGAWAARPRGSPWLAAPLQGRHAR